jgi:predicted ATP-binding protein involved in virulence
MKLKGLHLESYRGFADLSLNLDGCSALIIGKNGAGKSTILDAIATALFPLYKVLMQDKTQTRALDELDVRYGQIKAKIMLDIEHAGTIYNWGTLRDLNKRKSNTENRTNIDRLANQLREAIVQNQLAEENDQPPQDCVPIVAYYAANRAVKEVSFLRFSVSSSSRFQSFSAWEEALSIGLDFESFFKWFRNQEDIENEKRRYHHPEYVDPKLQAVRTAIECFLPNFRNLRYTRVIVERMLVDKDGMTLAVNQLSSGEKMLLALVGDLARRLAIANPSLENTLEGEGVVMIDEVEAHLHPGWQRMIINSFRRTFPNVQFLFSTHSPQVISEVRDMKMYLLNSVNGENKATLRKPVFGQDVNYVLEMLMDTDFRNEDVKNRLYYIFRLLERSELDLAQQELQALENLLEGLDKPADMLKAEATLIRKRTIGR